MEEFFIQDDGIRLHAKLDRPEGKEKCPLCLLIHGFTGNMEEPHLIETTKVLLSHGVAVLRIECYGHGQSDGAFRDHTLFKWMNNGLAAIHHAEKNFSFMTDLYVAGHSQGGLLTVLLAGLCPDRIKGIIPLSPAVMIPSSAREGMLVGQTFSLSEIPEELHVWKGLTLGGDYIRVAQSIQVDDYIKRFDGKVLIIHGTEDEAVPYSCSQELVESYRTARLVPVEGDDHCFNRHLDQMAKALSDNLPFVLS